MRASRSVLPVVVLLAALVALAACGSGGAASSAPAPTPTPTVAAAKGCGLVSRAEVESTLALTMKGEGRTHGRGAPPIDCRWLSVPGDDVVDLTVTRNPAVQDVAAFKKTLLPVPGARTVAIDGGGLAQVLPQGLGLFVYYGPGLTGSIGVEAGATEARLVTLANLLASRVS